MVFLSKIVSKEIADIHDRSVVFTGEPSSALSHLVPADVSAVASWRSPFCPSAVLLIGGEATHYYDDQIIEVPKGKQLVMQELIGMKREASS